MKRYTSIEPRLNILVVSFLFLTFLVTSTNLSTVCHELTGFSIRKAHHGWTKRDSQIPFEEKEKELESKTSDKAELDSILENLLRAIAQQPFLFLRQFHSRHYSGIPEPDISIPIYLSKRTLLI